MTVATHTTGQSAEDVNGSTVHDRDTLGTPSTRTGRAQHASEPRPPEREELPVDSEVETEDEDLLTYLSADGELLPGRVAPMSDEEAARLFASMVTIRLIDERMVMLQRQGRIGFYIGGSG